MSRPRGILLAAVALAGVLGCLTPDEPAPAPESGVTPPSAVAPLRAWMKANASTALIATNQEKLVVVFQRIGSFAPSDPDFRSWVEVAKAGERAAAAGDLDAVRDACRRCHDAHKAIYIARLRARALTH